MLRLLQTSQLCVCVTWAVKNLTIWGQLKTSGLWIIAAQLHPPQLAFGSVFVVQARHVVVGCSLSMLVLKEKQAVDWLVNAVAVAVYAVVFQCRLRFHHRININPRFLFSKYRPAKTLEFPCAAQCISNPSTHRTFCSRTLLVYYHWIGIHLQREQTKVVANVAMEVLNLTALQPQTPAHRQLFPSFPSGFNNIWQLCLRDERACSLTGSRHMSSKFQIEFPRHVLVVALSDVPVSFKNSKLKQLSWVSCEWLPNVWPDTNAISHFCHFCHFSCCEGTSCIQNASMAWGLLTCTLQSSKDKWQV